MSSDNGRREFVQVFQQIISESEPLTMSYGGDEPRLYFSEDDTGINRGSSAKNTEMAFICPSGHKLPFSSPCSLVRRD
jgi:hypothetical protein